MGMSAKAYRGGEQKEQADLVGKWPDGKWPGGEWPYGKWLLCDVTASRRKYLFACEASHLPTESAIRRQAIRPQSGPASFL